MFGRFIKKKRIYLDYAATTPVHPDVFRAMEPFFSVQFGNASSVHQEGVRAREAVEESRTVIAHTLSVQPKDVTFTSGGTESNNLAILGHLEYLIHETGMEPSEIEVITTATEHPSVSQVLTWIKKHGVSVYEAPIDAEGRIVVAEFEKLLSPKTRLVTVAYANSETGVVQDIGKLSRLMRAFEKKAGNTIVFHIDAAQAPLWLPCDPERLGVDMLSLDAGKCYGPKGVGVLIHRHRVKLSPVTYGGSQESGLRPGTENTPLIVGCVKAIERAQVGYESRSTVTAALRDSFMKKLEDAIDGLIVNGSKEHRLANNVNISIPGIDTEFAVVVLDTHGVAASTKSACSGASGGGSAVVRAMSDDEERAASTIRFSLGEESKESDIDKAVTVLKEHVDKMRVFQKT